MVLLLYVILLRQEGRLPDGLSALLIAVVGGSVVVMLLDLVITWHEVTPQQRRKKLWRVFLV